MQLQSAILDLYVSPAFAIFSASLPAIATVPIRSSTSVSSSQISNSSIRKSRSVMVSCLRNQRAKLTAFQQPLLEAKAQPVALKLSLSDVIDSLGLELLVFILELDVDVRFLPQKRCIVTQQDACQDVSKRVPKTHPCPEYRSLQAFEL